MAVSAQCPHCLAKLKLKNPDLVGKKVRCPSCQEPFRVEAPADNPAPAVASARRPKAKETEPTAGEDDWLNDLDSDGDEARESSVAAPPPVVGRKKRKRPTNSEAKPRRRRDDDGELSLTTHRVLMMVTGAVGGLIGVAIWGGIIYGTGYEVGYVAILVGFLAGAGVRVGASKWDFGWWPAITAVVIAAATIVGGKLVGVNLLLDSMVGEVQEAMQLDIDVAAWTHENMLISNVADEIATEWEEQGRELAWPEGEFEETGFDPETIAQTYPADVWAEAVKRWGQLADDEKQKRREEQQQAAEDLANLSDNLSIGLSDAGWLFSPWDLLWFGLACSGAFKIAAGWEDD
jgi:hypothetical protein